MVVKRVIDRGLFSKPGVREAGRVFLISLKTSNGYTDSYLDVLERSVALLASYAEDAEWPPIGDLTTSHVEEYLIYLQERPRWFGAQGNRKPRKMSQGYITLSTAAFTGFSTGSWNVDTPTKTPWSTSSRPACMRKWFLSSRKTR